MSVQHFGAMWMKTSEKPDAFASMWHGNITDYVLHCALGKRIINYDGIEALESQLKKIGNNLNQMVVIARQGRVEVLNLESVQQELAALHETLLQQLRKMEI